MLRTAAFDLDGVIADTFGIHIDGWTAVLRERGLPPPSSFDDLRGAERDAALTTLLRKAGGVATHGELMQARATKLAIRDQRIAALTPTMVMPGIAGLLDEAAQQHVMLMCISTNSATATILERLGLAEHFARVIAGDMLHPPKNESAACLLAELDAGGCDPSDALYLDDSRLACAHAAAAGIPTVYVGDGAPVPRALQRHSLADARLVTLYESARAALH